MVVVPVALVARPRMKTFFDASFENMSMWVVPSWRGARTMNVLQPRYRARMSLTSASVLSGFSQYAPWDR